MKDSIKALRELEKRLYAYQYAMAVADYDSETVAPPESSAGRAEAMEVLSRAYFDQLVSADTAALLQRAAADAETEQEKAEVRELQRSYDEIGKIPAEEYAAFTKLTQESMPAWGKAKRGNDFASFAPYLEKIVESLRAQAHYFAPDRDPYEVWLDRYEHGLTIAQCDTFFAALRETIVPLLAAIKERGSAIRTDFLYQDWPIEQQRKLSKKIMEVWGLDPDHCVLGETEHPFTSGFWHGDVRITTHYFEDNLVSSMFSVVHEGGHALYELGADDCYNYTALAGGVSMGIHESQSRFYENIIGRSPAYVHAVFPKLKELFPEQLADVDEEMFYRAINKAEPSLIRTEADELTYCLHIMVRYEIEKQLIGGTLAVKDVPAEWKRLYKQYLGVDVPSDREGCLQDSHWSGGSIGYFPSYALGSAYGAQMLHKMQEEIGDIWPDVAKGDLSKVTDWLRSHIHRYASFKKPGELFESVCGKFDAKYYTDYLTEKYTKLYGL